MDRLHQIAFAMLPGLGATSCRRWLQLYPDVDIFSLSPVEVRSIFQSNPECMQALLSRNVLKQAEEQMQLMERTGVRPIFFTDEDFPCRLTSPDTPDCPVLLYAAGQASLNPERSVAVVGTRKATPQGRELTAKLVRDLQPLHPTIVSGLAYGIDTAAHTAAVEVGLPTVAVLGHGLDRIYPPENRRLAEQIVEQGGLLLTEYPFGTHINAGNFPARNRIIAAMSDATVVVEAARKGGALKTAAIASDYHREVFAMPGRVTDPYSEGTNNLIAKCKALMLRHADDLIYQLGWPLKGAESQPARQTQLFPTLGAEAMRLMALLQQQDTMTIEELMHSSGLAMSHLSSTLFDLEMQGLVESLPGRCYRARIE